MQSGHHEAQTSMTIGLPLCLPIKSRNVMLFPFTSSNSLLSVISLNGLLFAYNVSSEAAFNVSFETSVCSETFISAFLLQLTAIKATAVKVKNSLFILFQFYFWV